MSFTKMMDTINATIRGKVKAKPRRIHVTKSSWWLPKDMDIKLREWECDDSSSSDETW